MFMTGPGFWIVNFLFKVVGRSTQVRVQRVYDSATGVKISCEKVLACRMDEMEEMSNHHVFDEVPERDAVPIRSSVFGRRQRRESTGKVWLPCRYLHSKETQRHSCCYTSTADGTTVDLKSST